MRLYWRSWDVMDRNYSLYIHVRAPDGGLLAQRDSYPGGGSYPTTFWHPGDIVIDSYRIPITVAVTTSTIAHIDVGLYALPDLAGLPAYDPAGQAITPVVGRLRIRPPMTQTPAPPARYTMGSSIALEGWQVPTQAQAGTNLPVTLSWRCLESPDRDYTIFLHLVGPDGTPRAQADGEPQGGSLPTSFWEPGESVPDNRTLILPNTVMPGQYRLVLGMYRLDTGQRLPVKDANGQSVGDSIVLETLTLQEH